MATFTVTGASRGSPTPVTVIATSANIDPRATVNWASGPQPNGQVLLQCVTGGFNGDGKDDLACYTGVSGSWQVALSNGGWLEASRAREGIAEEWPLKLVKSGAKNSLFSNQYELKALLDMAFSDLEHEAFGN